MTGRRKVGVVVVGGLLTVLTPAMVTTASATVPPPPDPTETSVAAPTETAEAVPAPSDTAPAQANAPEVTTVEAPQVYPGMTPLPSNVQTIGSSPVKIVAVGSKSGENTRLMQERLNQLGFWVGQADGKYGVATSQAVMAFQKFLGLKRTGTVDSVTAEWMGTMPIRAHGVSNVGTLVEIDKTRQLLFLVVDGQTQWTFNTSTGSGKPYEAVNKKDPTKIEKGDAQTPNGLYRTTRERPEGWWEGDLGKIYRPKYFVGGIAMHGMTSVPGYPASHGCVRLSLPAMDFLWDTGLIPVGTPVWVHS